MKGKTVLTMTVVASLLLTGGAYFVTKIDYERSLSKAAKNEVESSGRPVSMMASGIERSLSLVAGMTKIIALDSSLPLIKEKLPENPTKNDSLSIPEAKKLSISLKKAEETSDVISDVYAINEGGTCFSASNYDKEKTFIGQNFKERKYFTEALKKGSGVQYGFGSVSKQPGLYFSSYQNNGAVIVAKTELNQLSPWIRMDDSVSMLVDSNGVVLVATGMEGLSFKSLPKRRNETKDWAVPSGKEAEKLYGKSNIEQAQIGRFEEDDGGFMSSHGDFVKIDGMKDPYIRYDHPILGDGLSLVVLKKFGAASELKERREWLFTISSIIGILTCVLGGLGFEVRRRKQTEEIERLKRASAEEATKAKSAFLANMSHEIRTPMNAIIGLAGLSMEMEMSNGLKTMLRRIHVSSKALLGILNDVLDYSKIESGKLHMERIPFDPESLAAETADLFSANALAKNIELLLDVAPEVPSRLLGDPLRIGQALNNLVGNAVKFTEKGVIKIRVSVEKKTEKGIMLRFGVSDSGMGVSKEGLQKLFKPFAQESNETARKHGGTGLGLALVAKIASLMGGQAGANSRLGKGSTFWFSGVFPELPEGCPARGTVAKSGTRILVADDQEASLEILVRMLESWGYDVTAAASGEQALRFAEDAAASGHPFVNAVLDWKMPETDGLEVAKRLQELAGTELTQIALVSGFDMDALETEANAKGVKLRSSLPKPVTGEALANALSAGHISANSKMKESTKGSLKGMRVLVVDDNETNREIACTIVQRAGAETEVAFDGYDAVEKTIGAHKLGKEFDLILMDMHMPRMDGPEATKAIRKSSGVKDVSIIALSAAATASERNICLAAGMQAHVSKPVDPTELIMMMKSLTNWEGEHADADVREVVGENMSWMENLGCSQADIERAGSLEDLERMIKRFAGKNDLRIDDLSSGHDLKFISEISHAIKGEALSLGIKNIGEAAARVERESISAMKNNKDILSIDEGVKSLIEALKSFGAAVPQDEKIGGLAEMETAKDLPKPDWIDLMDDIEEMRILLKGRKSSAKNIAAVLFDKVKETTHSRHAEKIVGLISSFKYKEAEAILEENFPKKENK